MGRGTLHRSYSALSNEASAACCCQISEGWQKKLKKSLPFAKYLFKFAYEVRAVSLSCTQWGECYPCKRVPLLRYDLLRIIMGWLPILAMACGNRFSSLKIIAKSNRPTTLLGTNAVVKALFTKRQQRISVPHSSGRVF